MKSATSLTTFKVSAVEEATDPLPEIPYEQAAATLLGIDRPDRFEACSGRGARLLAGVESHPLIAALHMAFSTHRPISLSPDIVWLTLMQGFAIHVNENSAALRPALVRHDGKLTLSVDRNDFVRGSPDNAWEGAFSEISAKIHDHLGETHGLIVADFSTTGVVERAASEIVLMDATHAFFEFELRTLCGIPSITLEGSVNDWRSLARRARELRRFKLDFWVDELTPILEQFVAAAEGRVDAAFWESIYKWKGPVGSGTPHVSGWVLGLFPYLEDSDVRVRTLMVQRFTKSLEAMAEDDPQRAGIVEHIRMYGPRPGESPRRRNPWIGLHRSVHDGPGRDDFPRSPARAPFTWLYLDQKLDMQLSGGLFGVRQDPETLCLRPEIGWAVFESLAH